MRIGLDFDNTIVRYDEIFHRAALEQDLIPRDVPETKEAVRDYLRAENREDDWTKLQGHVYGTRMDDAAIFPGVKDFLATSVGTDREVFIISHKTKKPYLGPAYDLHEAARTWLETHDFFNPATSPLTAYHVFFELTKQDKMQRIADQNCDVFLDDLPELLTDPSFPTGVQRYLFAPEAPSSVTEGLIVVKSWQEFDTKISEYSA